MKVRILKKKSKYLNKSLFVSFLLYSIFGILFSIYSINYFRIPMTIGIVVFAIVIWNLFNYYLMYSQSYILFSLFIIWQFIIVIRFDSIDIEKIRFIFFDPNHLLSYLVPFLFFLPVNLRSLSNIIKALFFYSLAFMLLHFFIIFKYPVNNITDTFVLSSLAPIGIILLLSKYVNAKILIASLIILFSILYIALIYGRRSVILNTLLILLFSFVMNVMYNENIKLDLKFIYILISIFIFIFSINFLLINVDKNYFQIFDRNDTDSRSYVIKAFLKDFKSVDYIIGRGIDGSYHNPISYWNFSNDDYRDVVYRTNIENGFLYLIMKGGIINLLLFLLILFKAIYLGFFRSKNFLIKGIASYLFIYFVDMFAFGQPTFSIKYCLVWISIAVCFSKKYRSLNELQLKTILNSRNKRK